MLAHVSDFNAAEQLAERDQWQALCGTAASELLEAGRIAQIEVASDGVAGLVGDAFPAFKDDDHVDLRSFVELGSQTMGTLRQSGLSRAQIVSLLGTELRFEQSPAAGRYWILPTPPLEDLYVAVNGEAQLWSAYDGEQDPFQEPIAGVDGSTPSALFDVLQRPAQKRQPSLLSHDDFHQRFGDYRQLPSVCVLQGPPGTGKTRLMAERVADWTSQGASVLVTTFTNRAVDELLLATRATARARFVRVGRPHVRKHAPHVASAKSINAEAGCCVGATLFKVNTSFAGKAAPLFDVVVLDEASQVWLGPAMVLGRLARHLLVVGDPQQLPPLLHQNPVPEPYRSQQLDRSFVELAMARCVGGESFFLRHSYRLNPPVCQQVSALFYGGLLESHPSNAARFWPNPGRAPFDATPGLELVACASPAVEAKMVASLLLDCERIHGAWLTKVEAELKHEGPRYLLSCFKRAQIARVRRALADANVASSLWRIDTIERNQGRTASVGVLSLGVAANDPLLSSHFYQQPGRWTVALSRARFKTWVLCFGNEALSAGVVLGSER